MSTPAKYVILMWDTKQDLHYLACSNYCFQVRSQGFGITRPWPRGRLCDAWRFSAKEIRESTISPHWFVLSVREAKRLVVNLREIQKLESQGNLPRWS